MTDTSHTIEISPARVLALLTGIAALLLAGHAAATIAELRFGRNHLLGLSRMLNFEGELTIPAWYSSLLLLLCAILLALAWRVRRGGTDRFRRYWGALAVIFCFLALDEAVAIHEQLIDPVRNALDTGGAFLHAWVIPYGIAGLVLLLVYRPFLLALPRRTLHLMVASGALYVGGAVAVEMIGGYVWDRNPERGIPIIAIMALEETLEMVGLALFAYTLLDYLARAGVRITVRFSPAHDRARA